MLHSLHQGVGPYWIASATVDALEEELGPRLTLGRLSKELGDQLFPHYKHFSKTKHIPSVSHRFDLNRVNRLKYKAYPELSSQCYKLNRSQQFEICFKMHLEHGVANYVE